MNPDYILREQGAVLKWFDIAEIGGRFSLDDKLGDVIKTFRGKLWFAGLFLTLAKKMSQGQPQAKDKKKKKAKTKNPEMNSSVMNIIGGFTDLRLTGMLGMRNVTFTREELLKMIRQLNKIKSPIIDCHRPLHKNRIGTIVPARFASCYAVNWYIFLDIPLVYRQHTS